MPAAAGELKSRDGTAIAFDRYGAGPAVVLVQGAFADRRHPMMTAIATSLAPWFTVYGYDRRGRGGSGDTAPYAVEREIEDLAAVIAEAGGSAMVFGGSSGAALALEAAVVTPAISKLAVWEPPYHVDDTAPELPKDFARQLGDLVAAGRRAEAAERFMVEAAEVPAAAVAGMRADPSWPEIEALAHTLAYEAAVLGPGNALPAARLATITQPTLVLNGELSPGWMANAGVAVAAAVPGAVRRVLEGQAHNVAPEALAPELLEFFVAR
ncbi:Pimeloyl-ACP methyl ester carboxylesterase [Nonomuraea solani]|uniref:Pimeloyl-ACP methyl ester carboxylesterase n=1 Tax=Nonomuraea solani TaxID=1144553 RepID=A0A1H6DIT5_9ACTN|nr:alpha/beta fold hydrolase [Nonomuraea solani]SEG85150.1 Pimeloyl-ACP methyl ester carboxylesterase [Nonomuraea solani]